MEVAKQGGLGWRDWLGYIGVVALGYNLIGVSIVNGILGNTLDEVVVLKAMEMGELMTLLTGMLGLGGLQIASKGRL